MGETGGEHGVARCEAVGGADDFPTVFVIPRYIPVNSGQSEGGTKSLETRMEAVQDLFNTGVPVV
jgi:hypothetical protein